MTLSRQRWGLHRIAALGVIAVTGALGLACPAKELTINITGDRLRVFGVACNDQQAVCRSLKTRTTCNQSLICEWDVLGGCKFNDACSIVGNPPWSVAGMNKIEVTLAGTNPSKIRAVSRCTDASVAACEGASNVSVSRCLATNLNTAIDDAISDGLTFDGFQDASEAFPIVAFYDGACETDRLIACAGLAVPLNEESYDVACVSCQNGLLLTLGENSGPCPHSPRGCFFTNCAEMIAQFKSQAATQSP